MRYWQYRPDGTLWAPPGGKNLAFREMIAKDFGRADDAPREHDVRCRSTGRFANITTGIRIKRLWRGTGAPGRFPY